MIDNKKHFILNLSSTYLSIVVTAIVSFISVPFALDYFGKEVYGIWTILTTFSAYVTASGLGIDTATGNLMTKNPSINDKITILKKGLMLMFISCLIFSLIFLGINMIIPNWYRLIGKMDEKSYLIARPASILFVIITIIGMPFSVLSCSLASFGKAYLNTLLNMFQGVGNLFILLLVKLLSGNLVLYIFFIGIEYILLGLLKIIIISKTIKNERRVYVTKGNCQKNDDVKIKTIIRTGINLSLYGLPIMLVPNLSNLIISNFLDITSVVPYTIEYKLFTTAMGIVMAINMAAGPLLGKEFGNNNWEWLKQKTKQMRAVTSFLGVCLSIGMLYFSKYVVTLWTHDINNYPGDFVTGFLSLWVYLYCLNNVSLITINSFNYTNYIWVVSLIESVVFLVLSLVLIKFLGIAAISFSLFISVFIISSYAYPTVIKKNSNGIIKLYNHNYVFGLIMIVLFGLIHLYINRLNLELIIEFSINCVIYIVSVVLAFFVLTKDDRTLLLNLIKSQRNKERK